MGHTPGPWAVRPWGDNDYEINAALDTVCNVPGFDDDTVDVDRAEANANLIAAAPELLEACRYAIWYMREGLCGHPCMISGDSSAAEKIRAAIAKAEGRSE